MRSRWLVVGAAGVAVFMAMLDASIVNVALPDIGRGFGAPPDQTQWTILGYLLTMVAMMVPSGRWLDHVGKRAALIFGVSGFAVASLCAAFAPGLWWLVAARIVQGGFGAVIFALVPALVVGVVPAGERGRALGVLGTLGPLGSVAGPAIGGLLVSEFGWPSIFLVNVPAAALVIAMVLAAMPRDGRLSAPSGDWAADVGMFGGAVLVAMLALTLLPTGGAVWLLLLAPAALLAVLWRSRPHSRPLVALAATRGLTGPLLATAAVVCGAAIAQFLSPFYLERQLHASPSAIGFTLAALTATMALFGPIGGYLADRVGAVRIAAAGAAVVALGLLLSIPLTTQWQPLDLAWRLGVIGIGLGLFAGPNQAALIGAAPQEATGSASALSGLAMNMAFAFGPALATVAWAADGYDLAGMRLAMGVATVCAALSLGAYLLRRAPGTTPVEHVPQHQTSGRTAGRNM